MIDWPVPCGSRQVPPVEEVVVDVVVVCLYYLWYTDSMYSFFTVTRMHDICVIRLIVLITRNPSK